MEKNTKNDWKKVFITSLFVGGFLSLSASSFPDGLEKVAGDQGFLATARQYSGALMSDYVFPGVRNQNLATSLAGMVGTVIVCVFLFGIGKALYRR